MSLGLYNNVADIDRTLELTREWTNRETGAPAARILRGGVQSEAPAARILRGGVQVRS
jgi:hypothetical protein